MVEFDIFFYRPQQLQMFSKALNRLFLNILFPQYVEWHLLHFWVFSLSLNFIIDNYALKQMQHMANTEDFIKYIPQCSACEKVASWRSQDITVQYRDLLTADVWEWAHLMTDFEL